MRRGSVSCRRGVSRPNFTGVSELCPDCAFAVGATQAASTVQYGSGCHVGWCLLCVAGHSRLRRPDIPACDSDPTHTRTGDPLGTDVLLNGVQLAYKAKPNCTQVQLWNGTACLDPLLPWAGVTCGCVVV